MARVGFDLGVSALQSLRHRGFAENKWFDLKISNNNPDPDPNLILTLTLALCVLIINLSTSVWRMEISVDRLISDIHM